MLRRNLIANYVGQTWVALMGLAFVPLYIKYLGIEAYGLIGLFVLLKMWLQLLDMGMTPTLSREMARSLGGGHTPESIRDLLRSIEVITFGVAIVVASGVASSANWLAESWLKPETLSENVVARAFTIMALVTALHFVESVYRSCILGLQRQVLLNVINGVMATLRGLGAVGILAWVSPTIQAFFVWQVIISFITLVVLATTTYRTLPKAARAGQFSVRVLRSVWRFAGGMLGITFLALLLTQVDKILLSRLLTLGEYGYYALASAVAGALFILVNPVTQAWYPKLCQLCASDDRIGFAYTYHSGAQLVTVIAGSAAMVVILFAETLLQLWTQDGALAQRVAPLLSLLMLGNLLNGLMRMPYQSQLAHGWTDLTVRMNIVAVLIIVPAILWATPRYGAEGAAWVWVTLNAGYVFIGVHFMFRRILTREKWRWYLQDVLMPLGMGAAAAAIVKMLAPVSGSNLEQLGVLFAATAVTFSVAVLSGSHTRHQARASVKFVMSPFAKSS